jgi:hypothetical protein
LTEADEVAALRADELLAIDDVVLKARADEAERRANA